MGRDLLTFVAPYIGVPYKSGGRDPAGWDCWGVVHYVARTEFGFEVPDYLGYDSAELREQVSPIFVRERLVNWEGIKKNNERPGDVVIFTATGHPIHCGVVIDPPLMLHCLAGRDTVIESYHAPLWRRRIEGFYRWPTAA